ncbi:MAG: O-antigen ligase family protein [Blastocatellia bacterium]|nr:O-antigen ligase family protein [Blastocatellia bacterium]
MRVAQFPNRAWWSRAGALVAIAGLLLYSVFAPHSIAAGEISLAIAGAGWLLRTFASRTTGFRRTSFDLPIGLFFLWTILSSFLSVEPHISIAKIQSTCVIFLFYLTQAIATRRTAVLLVSLVILSGAAGTVYSIYDLLRGRGIVVESIAPDSPLHSVKVQPNDAIWRVGGRRVYSVADIDQAIRNAPTNSSLTVGIISQGEHVERLGMMVTDAAKSRTSPSGIIGSKPTHRFRASGWTRHYETYAEILQILAQLALGLALAHLLNHGLNRWSRLAFLAAALLALGLALTAMRTALIAFAVGVVVISWRALRGRGRIAVLAGLSALLLIGAFVVFETRARQALFLQDPSSSLRVEVARVGLSRIMLHPLFGHGMDAMKVHWNEWGFPGSEMLHLHSTPLQLAFDRGLPALCFWLWIVWLFWRLASRNEKRLRETLDTNRYGILLGATGALAGFFASSLVNYNLGDGEVALVFWWLLGLVIVVSANRESSAQHPRG